MVNEERLVGQGSDRRQCFRFADAPMIKKLGFVLLMVPCYLYILFYSVIGHRAGLPQDKA